MKKESLIGSACSILSAILFGFMPLMANPAFSSGSNAYTIAFGRFLTGSMFCAGMIQLLPGYSFRIGKAQVFSLFKISLFFAVMPVLLYSAYDLIGAGMATTLHFTYPAVVLIITSVLLRRKPEWIKIICCILCLSGIFMIYHRGGGSLKGIALAAVSGVIYACYIILFERSDLDGLPLINTIFWISLFSSMEIGLYAMMTHKLLLDLPSSVWISYLALGIIAMVIAILLFQTGVLLCGSLKASLYSTLEPVTGVFVGVTFYHEAVDQMGFMGIILILASVIGLSIFGD